MGGGYTFKDNYNYKNMRKLDYDLYEGSPEEVTNKDNNNLFVKVERNVAGEVTKFNSIVSHEGQDLVQKPVISEITYTISDDAYVDSISSTIIYCVVDISGLLPHNANVYVDKYGNIPFTVIVQNGVVLYGEGDDGELKCTAKETFSISESIGLGEYEYYASLPLNKFDVEPVGD